MVTDKVLLINTSTGNDLTYTQLVMKILQDQGIEGFILHWSGLMDVKSLDPHPAVFICASPRGDNANFYHRLKAFQWLPYYENPVLGICAGHQLTGVIYGARLLRDFQSEEGEVNIKLHRKDNIFDGFENTISGYQHHNDSISLPDDFILLASSKICEVQAIRHIRKPIYTFQWHVEISNPGIIINFINITQKKSAQN